MARKNRVKSGNPKAVDDAAKKAEELHAEIYGEPESDTNTEQAAAPAENAAGEGGDIQPVEPQVQVDSTGDTPVQEGAAEVHELSPPSDPAPEPAPEPEDEWKKKYEVLQGKYNAEVPRMASEMRQMRDQMNSLMAAPAPAPEPAPEAEEKKPVVSDQDMVDYGEDLIDLIRRVAQGEVSTVSDALTPQIEQVRGQVVKSAQQQATDTVYSTLDREIKDWKEINKSAEFLAWLGQSDPYAGDLRKNLLSDAFSKGHSGRVAAFFQGYLAEKQLVTPQPTPTPPAPVAESAPQMTLEQLAGPASGGNGAQAPATARQPENWTRAQIASFYQNVAAGAFSKDPQRKAHIENSIAVAMKEGRVT